MRVFQNKIGKIVIIIILIGLVCGVYWLYTKNQQKNMMPDDSYIAEEEEIEDFFENISLGAKSAFVWDIKDKKVLYSLNEEAQLPLASLTKLMTALVAYELVPSGTIITIDDSDIEIEGNSGFSVGEKWRMSEVLDFILMTSSNDGAHALASVIGFVKQDEEKTPQQMFVEEMNKKAKEIGLIQTFYLNESGLDLSRNFSGAYGSAKDMAILMANIIQNKPEILEATRHSELKINSKKFVYDVFNTNKYAENTPGILGSKTGFTDLAGGNLVIGFDVGIGHPIIVSVLGSTKEGRFEDVRQLVNASIETVAGIK